MRSRLSNKQYRMTDFAPGDKIAFAGGRGEITRTQERPNGGYLLHVYTTEGQLRKLPSGLPHIERIGSIIGRLAAKQIDGPLPSNGLQIQIYRQN